MANTQDPKKDFPILNRQIKGKSLVYLDNASTTQKPRQVIDALTKYYENHNSNIHRGIHTLSEEATASYEKTRHHTEKFINAKSEKEIVFTKNTTESINLVAQSWGNANIGKDDEIIVSALEHHSNLVPWQELCRNKRANLRIISIKDDYTLDLEEYKRMLNPRTKLVTLTGMSNVLGTVPPIKEMIAQANAVGATTLIDAAQSAAHSSTDVQDLNCDFLTFSAHKMLGPTGVGVLYGKREILEEMPPFMHGGDMVLTVTDEKANWNEVPHKFEAGTPNIAGVIAFDQALSYLEKIGLANIHQHDQKLLQYAKEKFSPYKAVRLHCPENGSSVLSFTIKGVHPHDIAAIFDEEGVAIRSGYHCAQPLMDRINVTSTARISFYLYNTMEDVDRAEKALKNVLKIFKITQRRHGSLLGNNPGLLQKSAKQRQVG